MGIDQKTLFLGNGLNRCLSGGVAWGDLLKDIATKYNVPYDSNIEMPLEFERIINEYLKSSNCGSLRQDMTSLYYAIKLDIAKTVQYTNPLGPCVHKSIPFGIVRNIITTNYDTILEQAYYETHGKHYTQPSGSKKRIKYYLSSTMDDEKVAFYHPHGIVTHPSSICLGYEHYMGLVETIRSSSNSQAKKDSKGNPLTKPEMKISRILRGADPFTDESWEKFYTTDMAFVGFGLPSCESDIWWLLTHRAYLYYSNYPIVGNLIQNHIIYYDVIALNDKRLLKEEVKLVGNHYEFVNPKVHYSNKHKLLDGMHVDVRLRVIGPEQNYATVYTSILEELSDADNWKACHISMNIKR